MAQRIWSETVPLATLGSPAVLDLVAGYDLDLLAAVRPWELDHVPALLGSAARSGVRLSLWPMLDDDAGRWLSVVNLDPFGRFVHALLDRVEGCPDLARAGLVELAFDLEPPFGLVAAATGASTRPGGWRTLFAEPPRTDGGPTAWPWTPPWEDARQQLGALVEAVRGRGVAVSAAVVPMVLLDPPDRAGAWQRIMGTPVDGIPFDRVSVMLYTSLFEGWSRGTLRRPDALGLLAEGCRLARSRYGARASVSLGAVGPGALGNEPVYRGPHELAEEVALLHALGLDDLVLFDLGGVLDRGDPNAWLDAFIQKSPATDCPPNARVRLVRSLGRAAGRAWQSHL